MNSQKEVDDVSLMSCKIVTIAVKIKAHFVLKFLYLCQWHICGQCDPFYFQQSQLLTC